MTEPVSPPSNDPADDDSLAGLLRATYRKFLQQTDGMLPAVVTAYDRAKNRAQVRPCIAVLTTDGRTVARAQIASIPVMQFGGGGIVLNFNLQPGDLGWIVANDRDISQFLQAYKEGAPNTHRLHTFQDAVFIPDVMKGWTIAGEDAARAVLQSLDGSVKVALDGSTLKLQAGASSVTMTNAGVTIVAPTITLNGIPWGTHKHTGVVPGGGTSGGPTP